MTLSFELTTGHTPLTKANFNQIKSKQMVSSSFFVLTSKTTFEGWPRLEMLAVLASEWQRRLLTPEMPECVECSKWEECHRSYSANHLFNILIQCLTLLNWSYCLLRCWVWEKYIRNPVIEPQTNDILKHESHYGQVTPRKPSVTCFS